MQPIVATSHVSNRHAFSLVELSIVLVILGLLTGGILAGQSLIRAAELRAVSTEYGRYTGAMQTFRDQYTALPGDMINATSYWGVAHATPATCATTQGTGTQTCNGDGDGLVELIGSFAGSAENFRFWQHLANAGLIEGSYTGILGSAGNTDHMIPGTNVPTSKMSNAGWGMRFLSSTDFVSNYPAMLFGGPVSNSIVGGGILKPEEAFNVDTKIDDGKPGTGTTLALSAANCASSTTANTATYALSTKSTSCAFIFKIF